MLGSDDCEPEPNPEQALSGRTTATMRGQNRRGGGPWSHASLPFRLGEGIVDGADECLGRLRADEGFAADDE